MFFYRIKYIFLSAFAILLIIAIGLCVRGQNVIRLRGIDGERAFYLQSASSQGLRKERLGITDLFKVKGESVRFTFEGESEETLVSEILSAYNGEICFLEDVGETRSYYCKVEDWGNGITLYGQKINLHVAVNKNVCVVGTPIIFDGF